MEAATTHPAPTLIGRATRGHLIIGALLLLLTVYMVGKYLHHDLKDTSVWYDVGRRVLTGQTLVNLPHYRYPPTFAVIIAPLCIFGQAFFYFAWYALSLLFFYYATRLSAHLVWGDASVLSNRARWAPLLLVAPYALDNLVLGQTNLLIMALALWAFVEDARGRQWLAGLPLGAAVAIKVFPAPLILYLLYRRRWAAATSALLASAFFLFLLPSPARGFQRNAIELSAWADRVALPFVSKGQAGDWGQHSLDFGNHSLPAVARRFLTQTNAQVAARERAPIYVNIAALNEQQVNRVVLAGYAALCLAFIWAIGWTVPDDRLRRATEYALVTVLLLLTSALSWTYFFVMLLLPLMAACRALGEGGLPRRESIALQLAIAALVTATLLIGNHYARSLGSLFWASLLLFFALAAAVYKLRRGAARG